MIIGVDFDNTLVRYDELFHSMALQNRWISPATPVNKTSVRDAMRASDMEQNWITLQGLVYGVHIEKAPAYEHARTFFTQAINADITLYIVSHKTPFPVSGHEVNLHDAATKWLELQGFIGGSVQGISQSCVFFEHTKAAKLSRIASLGCDHFIDDLPEFLAEPSFPKATRKWLFDPAGCSEVSDKDVTVLSCWKSACEQIIHSLIRTEMSQP